MTLHLQKNKDAKSKRDGSIGGMVNLMSVDCETINGLMGKSQIQPFYNR